MSKPYNGVNIILFTPTPEFSKSIRCFGKNDQWFNLWSKEDCKGSKNSYIDQYHNINQVINKLSEKNKNVFVIDGLDTMCSEKTCYFTENKRGLYYDEDHISNFGSMKKIFPALMEVIKKNEI